MTLSRDNAILLAMFGVAWMLARWRTQRYGSHAPFPAPADSRNALSTDAMKPECAKTTQVFALFLALGLLALPLQELDRAVEAIVKLYAPRADSLPWTRIALTLPRALFVLSGFLVPFMLIDRRRDLPLTTISAAVLSAIVSMIFIGIFIRFYRIAISTPHPMLFCTGPARIGMSYSSVLGPAVCWIPLVLVHIFRRRGFSAIRLVAGASVYLQIAVVWGNLADYRVVLADEGLPAPPWSRIVINAPFWLWCAIAIAIPIFLYLFTLDSNLSQISVAVGVMTSIGIAAVFAAVWLALIAPLALEVW